MVGRDGFEPPNPEGTDLQSVAFNRTSLPPRILITIAARTVPTYSKYPLASRLNLSSHLRFLYNPLHRVSSEPNL